MVGHPDRRRRRTHPRDRSNVRSTVVLLAKTGYLGPESAAFVLRDIRGKSGAIALPVGVQTVIKMYELQPAQTYHMEG